MSRRSAAVASAVCLGVLGVASAASAHGPVRFNAHWGGVGVIAGFHGENLCLKQRIEPGSHREAIVAVNGPHDAVAHGPSALYGTLMCAPELSIWPQTTGPWEGGRWISLHCPGGEKPLDGGAGFTVFGGNSGALGQTGGGFGHNRDGYWDYRFFNHSVRNGVAIEFWAVCVGHKATTV